MAVGATNSTDPFKAEGQDVLVAKLDKNLEPIWVKSYGGIANDWARSVVAGHDGQILILGNTNSGFPSDEICLWVLDSAGNVIAINAYPKEGTSQDIGYWILPAADGGYLLLGGTNAYSSGFNSEQWPAIRLIKISGNFYFEWDKYYFDPKGGLTGIVFAPAASDYIIAGYFGNNQSPRKAILLKVDSQGEEYWRKKLESQSSAELLSVLAVSDGGYRAAGEINIDQNTGKNGSWFIKTDSQGQFPPEPQIITME